MIHPKEEYLESNSEASTYSCRYMCPSTPASNSNKSYILLFIDDYSRKTWVHFLVEKSEALNSFKYFKTMVEKEADMFIKCLRTDRGGEFNSNEFNHFCKESGIKRQLTTAFTPQQNDVTERKNRIVMAPCCLIRIFRKPFGLKW